MRTFAVLALILALFSGTESAHADYKHQLLRRVAVFPIANVQGSNSEEAWWQMREVLTQNQRFLVASRRFMINRGVFQPRESLKPADAIILGKILDAQAIVTAFVQERRMYMNVYDGENGYLLWQGEIEFHPALPINEQIVKLSQKMMADFVLALPYQGYVIVDSIREKAVFQEGSERRAWVAIGNTKRISVGDSVQWIEVVGDPTRVFFKEGSQSQVIAEGQVVQVQEDRVLVSIQKLRAESDIQENSLVRFPKEVNLLKDLYSHTDKTSNLSAEYLSAEMKTYDELKKKHPSTSTSLAFIFSLASMILLAF